MNITSIKDVGDMTGGDPVLAMRVTVKNAYPPKGGTNEWGDWSVQNATLEDDTGTIKGGFFNSNQDLRNFTGGQVTIKSGKDQKGKFSGIEVYDYTNKKTGAVERQLKVSENVTFEEVVGGQGGFTAPPTQAPANTSPASRPARFTEDAEEKRESIERQVALREAVNFAGVYENPTAAGVVENAEKFYQFLSGVQVPMEEKKEAQPDGDSQIL
jgi:hypothetical protein